MKDSENVWIDFQDMRIEFDNYLINEVDITKAYHSIKNMYIIDSEKIYIKVDNDQITPDKLYPLWNVTVSTFKKFMKDYEDMLIWMIKKKDETTDLMFCTAQLLTGYILNVNASGNGYTSCLYITIMFCERE